MTGETERMEKGVLAALWEAHNACPPDGACLVEGCGECLKCSIAEMCFHIEYPELFPHTAGGENEGHEHKGMVRDPLRFALERCRAWFVKQRDFWEEDVPGQRAASNAENMESWVKGIDMALAMHDGAHGAAKEWDEAFPNREHAREGGVSVDVLEQDGDEP